MGHYTGIYGNTSSLPAACTGDTCGQGPCEAGTAQAKISEEEEGLAYDLLS